MRIEPCKVCGNREFDYLFEGSDRVHYLPGQFKLYRCRVCRLILVYPPLSDQELQNYYPQDYYSYENARRVQPLQTRKEKFFHFLTHPFQALNCLCYSKILDQNRELPVKPNERILDIGCGDGKFLMEKLRSGCLCYGNDISEPALARLRKNAPGIETRCGNLWDAHYDDNFFDKVNASHVIEHVKDFDKLLAEARRILKTGGLLRVQVPNAASLSFLIFGKYWMPLEVPRHVYAFSLPNLRSAFRKAGLDVVSERTVEGSFTFIASVFFFLSSVLGKKIMLMRHERVWNSELLKLLLFPYALFVNLFHWGDTAEFFLQKSNAPIPEGDR